MFWDHYGSFGSGFNILRSSLRALDGHGRLLLYPLGAGLLLVCLSGVLVLPPALAALHAITSPGSVDGARSMVYPSDGSTLLDSAPALITWSLLVAAVLAVADAVMVAACRRSLAGDSQAQEPITATLKVLPQIGAWAFVAAVGGMVSRIVAESASGWYGGWSRERRLIDERITTGWSTRTMLATHVIVHDRSWPMTAYRRSKALAEARWDVAFDGVASLGLIIGATTIAYVVGMFAVLNFVSAEMVVPVLVVLAVVGGIAVPMLRALRQVFAFSVYHHSSAAIDPAGYASAPPPQESALDGYLARRAQEHAERVGALPPSFVDIADDAPVAEFVAWVGGEHVMRHKMRVPRPGRWSVVATWPTGTMQVAIGRDGAWMSNDVADTVPHSSTHALSACELDIYIAAIDPARPPVQVLVRLIPELAEAATGPPSTPLAPPNPEERYFAA